MLTVFVFYKSRDVEAEAIIVPTAVRSTEKNSQQKHKKIYPITRNIILNHHPALISESARHYLYRVHRVEIGTK